MNIATLLIFQACAALAEQLFSFALIWKILNWFNSPLPVTLCTASFSAAGLLFMPWIGGYVDRSHRLKTAAKGDILYVATSLGLLASLPLIHSREFGLVLLLFFYALFGVARSIQSTAFMSGLADIADDESRGQVFARWSSVSTSIGIVAAPLSAALLAVFQIKQFILIQVTTSLLAVFNTVRVARRVPAHRIDHGNGMPKFAPMDDIRSVYRILKANRLLIAIMLCTPILNFIEAPVISLMPALVKIDWHLGVKNVALVQMLMACGLMSSSLLLSVWRTKWSHGSLILLGLLIITVSLGLSGGWRGAAEYQLYGAVYLFGFAAMLCNIPCQTLIAEATPESMRGRVMALLTVFAGGTAPVGMIVFGAIAQSFSTRLVVWLAASLFFAVTTWIGFIVMKSASLRRNLKIAPPNSQTKNTTL